MRKLQSKKCETCETEFQQGYNVSKSKWDIMRFCCFACRRHSPETLQKISKTKKESPTTVRGETHHNWKGGVTPEHNKIRGSLEYVLWRNEVYARDNWSCRICKEKLRKGNIIAHHIKKFADFPELRFIIENGLTLCRKCHIEIESPNITHV